MDTMTIAMMKKNLQKSRDLEKTMTGLAIKQQRNYYTVAIYDLLFNYITFLEMVNEDEKEIFLKMDHEFDALLTYITSLLDNANDLRNLMIDTEELLVFRNKLESKIIALTAYADEVQVYEYILNRIEGRFIKDYYDLEDDNSFAGNLIRFTFQTEDNLFINETIQMFMSQLPIRMTKHKFYEYVEHSFDVYKGVYIRDLNNYIKRLKDSIMPKELKEYEQSFDAIRENIKRLEKADYTNMSQPDYEHMDKILQDASDSINEIMAVYTIAVSIINNLIELSLCDQFDQFGEDKDLLDASNLLYRIGNNKENFIMDDILTKALEDKEGVIESSMDNVNSYHSLVNTVTEKHSKGQEQCNLSITYENLRKLDYMTGSSSYFMNPNGINMVEDDQQVDDFTLAKIKKEFIQTIDEHLHDKSREYRRAIMGQLFLLLPVSFKSPQDFHGYIVNALQQCSDIHEKNASKELIRQIMEDLS